MSASLMQAARPALADAFGLIDSYVAQIEALPVGLDRNVRLLAACKCSNHLYAAIQLVEAGMLVDAMLCARNALEVVAFHWLVILDPSAAQQFADHEKLRPVDVRKRLGGLGVDIRPLAELYSNYSAATHVGRDSDNVHSTPVSENAWELNFGGHHAPARQGDLLHLIPTLAHLFLTPIMIATTGPAPSSV